VIRVVVVDDHPIVRDGIIAGIAIEPDVSVVAAVGSAEEALDLLKRTPVDVLVLDHSLPGKSGVDACADLQQRREAPRVVILSGAPTALLLRRALLAGAVGFVAKDAPPSVLRESIRTVHGGDPYLDQALTRLVFDLVGRGQGKRGPYGLTPSEMDVVVLLPKGLMNREIAAELGITENTVKTHLRHALRKLGVRDRAQAAAIVVKEGWE
jgi:DNA-binding NarL/FixJ family response regulator